MIAWWKPLASLSFTVLGAFGVIPWVFALAGSGMIAASAATHILVRHKYTGRWYA
jgi:hypothetical protein